MTDLRDEVDRIIDVFGRLSKLADLRAKSYDAMMTDRRVCGNCYWWMKSRECPREHNVNGYTRGPSMNALACDKFQLTDHARNLKAKRIARVDAELKQLGL